MESEDSSHESGRKSIPELFHFIQIQKRYVVAILCALAIGSAVISKGSIEKSLEKLMNRKNISETERVSHCPRGPGNKTERIYDSHKEWSPTIQHVIVYSYCAGYVVSQVPIGMIAERRGFKWPLVCTLLASAIINVMIPISVKYGGSVAYIVLNTMLGLAQGGMLPTVNVFVARWIPLSERTTFGATLHGCKILGNIFAAMLALRNLHWSFRYYIAGISAIFAIVMMFTFKSVPSADRLISVKEQEYLKASIKNVSPLNEVSPTPWRQIIRSFPFWGFFVVECGHSWFFYGVVIDMPVYFEVILRFSRPLVLLWATVPLIVFFISLVSWAIFTDHMLKEGLLGLSELRTCNTALGTIGPGIMLIFCSYSNCYYHLTVFLYIACMALAAVYHSGAGLNAIDLAPNYAGTLMGVSQTVASLTIFGPFIIELIAPRETLTEWRHGFWVDWAIITVGFFIYSLFGSSKLQDWNTPNATKEVRPPSE